MIYNHRALPSCFEVLVLFVVAFTLQNRSHLRGPASLACRTAAMQLGYGGPDSLIPYVPLVSAGLFWAPWISHLFHVFRQRTFSLCFFLAPPLVSRFFRRKDIEHHIYFLPPTVYPILPRRRVSVSLFFFLTPMYPACIASDISSLSLCCLYPILSRQRYLLFFFLSWSQPLNMYVIPLGSPAIRRSGCGP